MNAREELDIQFIGASNLPTLVYLPGTHGDWTLAGAFREAMAGKVRLVSFAYPLTTTWSLAQHASAVATALSVNCITHGWLLGESFGSQVVWALLQNNQIKPKRFDVDGIILAGGFASYPIKPLARLGLALTGSKTLMKAFFWSYPKFAVFRHRHAPAVRADIPQFMARRARPGDHEALRHRLRLVINNDPSDMARAAAPPIYCLAGLIDPIVPRRLVNRWFRQNCPSLRATKVILNADHNVLSTAPESASRQILKWMGI
jgi:pimeloyl-ACP methyl ester carboxylesterase